MDILVPLVHIAFPPEKGNGPQGSLWVLVQYTLHKYLSGPLDAEWKC